MKTKIILYIVTATIVIVSSCESILEIKPISTITSANYWKTESDVKGYLVGLYNDFRGLTNTTLYGEDRGDAMSTGIIGPVTRSHTQDLNEEYGLDWLNFYNNLHHCNMIIKYTPGIAFNIEADKNRILAQAYTMRAKTYLTLIQMWGDVPIVLEPTESDADTRTARSSASTVMIQILEDVQRAIDLYPESTIPDKNQLSKPAALCLKAEALAWKYTVLKSNDTSDLTMAVEALEEVEKCGVSLLDKYADVFDAEHKKNNEVIFAIFLQKDELDNMYAYSLSMSAAAGMLTDDISNKEDIPYTNSTIARHVYSPSPRLISLFSSKDTRAATAYIQAIKKSDGKVAFVSQNKFRGRVYPADRYYDNDIMVYRLAEVMLLKAELLCYMGGANVQRAIDTMLPVRERAGIGAYTGPTDQKSVQREILDERGRELCFELKRWPDLMRAHAAGTIDVHTYIPNYAGKSTPLYFPILRSMINQNPKLEQTQGY